MPFSQLLCNNEHLSDTSRKTRPWIGAIGLMTADPPPEQMFQISKACGGINVCASEVAILFVKTGVKCGSSTGWDCTQGYWLLRTFSPSSRAATFAEEIILI